MEANKFVELHQQGMNVLGFWSEETKEAIKRAIEMQYKPEILRQNTVVDFAIVGDKVLVKWHPRFLPLTDDELKNRYGK